MKLIRLLSLLLFFNTLLNAQNLKKVDAIIYSYIEPNSIEELSNRIDYDFKTDLEKVRAIYNWIALNIEYDVFKTTVLNSPEFFIYQNNDDLNRIKRIQTIKQINKTFDSKKGVCVDYALLFNKICNLLNIKNELVYGYTKSSVNQIGIIPTSKNHVWNAVYINNKWIMIDVTYGSGYVYKNVWQKKLNLDYFNASKEKLKLTHFPSKKIWQDHLNQKPLKEFCLAPFYKDIYFKQKLNIIEPESGLIRIDNNNKRIYLKIDKLLDTNNILYLYSSDNVVRKPIIKKEKHITSISFKNPKENTNLHIYIENKLALEYKIRVN